MSTQPVQELKVNQCTITISAAAEQKPEVKIAPDTPTWHECLNCNFEFECEGKESTSSGCRCITGVYTDRANKWNKSSLYYYCSDECYDEAINKDNEDSDLDEYVFRLTYFLGTLIRRF